MNKCMKIFVLGHNCVVQGYTGHGTTWANEMNFAIKHAPGAGSITQSVDLQSNALANVPWLPLPISKESIMKGNTQKRTLHKIYTGLLKPLIFPAYCNNKDLPYIFFIPYKCTLQYKPTLQAS